jgi:RNA polymerase primary sigma factor
MIGTKEIMLVTKNNTKQKNSNREMRLYLKEIAKIPLLSADEEKELGRRVQKGDKEALQKMVESNLRFVIKIAKKYRGHGISFLDLINEGNLGLIEAAKRFDPGRNVKFTSYAVWWIRQSILHAISSLGHPMKLPAKVSNTLYRVGKTIAKSSHLLNRRPTLKEIADDVGITEKELNAALELAGDATSLNQPLDKQGELVLGDMLEDTTVASVEETTISKFLKEHLNEALHELDRNEEKVLRMRFGLDDEPPRTLKQIGDKMGLSRERIRQIEAKALGKLRSNRRSASLQSYLN